MASHKAIPSSLVASMKRKCEDDESLSPKKAKKQPVLVFSASLWARIVEYLPYSSVVPVSAVSPFFRKEVFPLVKTLFIDKPRQLSGLHAKRFVSVKSVFLVCLETVKPYEACRTAPFLQAFSELKYVFFGSILKDVSHPKDREPQHSPVTGVCHCPLKPIHCHLRVPDDYGRNATDWADECYDEPHLIKSICAFLDSGLIKSSVRLDGIVDDFECSPYCRKGEDCETCTAACKVCPLKKISHIAGKICLPPESLAKILLRRPGGRELLVEKGLGLMLSGVAPRQHWGEECSTGPPSLDLIQSLVKLGAKRPEEMTRKEVLFGLFRDPHNPSRILPIRQRLIYLDDFRLLVYLKFPIEEKDVNKDDWVLKWWEVERGRGDCTISTQSRPKTLKPRSSAPINLVPIDTGRVATKPRRKEKSGPMWLPAEVWALIVEYLPYSELLPVSSTTPFFEQEVFPLVKTLFIDSANQLNPLHARRFPAVTSIFMLCCSEQQRMNFAEDVDEDYEDYVNLPTLDANTSIWAAPFLQMFKELKFVFVGCLEEDVCHPSERRRQHSPRTNVCHAPLKSVRYCGVFGFRYIDEEKAEQEFQLRSYQMILSIAASLGNGGIAYDVHFGGLFEDFEGCFGADPECELCQAIYSEYPLEQVSGLYENWNLCTAHQKRFDILACRPGGLDCLKQKGFIPLLANASDYDLYDVPENAIRRLIEMGCRPQDVARAEMLRAIFPCGDKGVRDVNLRTMKRSTFERLVELNFPLRRSDLPTNGVLDDQEDEEDDEIVENEEDDEIVLDDQEDEDDDDA